MGYVVTGFVNRIGRRDTISKRMTKQKAISFKRRIKKEVSNAIPKYKWINKLRIERR